MFESLNKYRILLASKSPRRRELMRMLDIPFEIADMIEVEESYPSDLPAREVPSYLAALKAAAYATVIKPGDLVVTADTVVINDGKVLGKPSDRREAAAMLRAMSGHKHTVVTGVSLTAADRQVSFDASTDVMFASLTDEEINYYVAEYSPMDKAGAYGIQEWIGAAAVIGIEGSFYNVMGLPVHQLYRHLRAF